VLFVIITLLKVRELIIEAVPLNLKYATAVGIGVFIAFIGLQHAGIVAKSEETLVTLGNLRATPTVLAITGLAIMLFFLFVLKKLPGAILWGILATTGLAVIFGLVKLPEKIITLPDLKPLGIEMDIVGAFKLEYIHFIIILLYFDIFDTLGTLIGVGEQAGFLINGKLPRISRALLADSIGTVGGSLFGTSTITSYIESASGVAAGARTGLANLFTAVLFLGAIFFTPVAEMIGQPFFYNQTPLYPITAPALILVGAFMAKSIGKINWGDLSEGIPAFLIIILMPLTFRISDGLAMGFISHVFIKILAGKAKEVHWLMYILVILFVLRYIFLVI
jgi:AGZA family xanthine/uracil permease-like MFS transporter